MVLPMSWLFSETLRFSKIISKPLRSKNRTLRRVTRKLEIVNETLQRLLETHQSVIETLGRIKITQK